MTATPCSIDGCPRPRKTRGWCGTHYERWRVHGDPHYGPIKVCTVDGCERRHKSGGLCALHGDRLRRTGIVGPVELTRVSAYSGAACSIDGCEKRAAKRGWCGMHYRRWLKAGDPNTVLLIRVESGQPCEVCGGETTGRRRYCSPAHHVMAARLARGKITTHCVDCGVELPKIAGTNGSWKRGNGHGRCLRCADRVPCPQCGGPRKRSGTSLVCRPCRRPGAQRDQLLRRARQLDAICEHGDECVTRAAIAEIRSKACMYCGAASEHADHFQPLAKGGKHCRDNLVPACAPCNLTKSDNDPWEWWSMTG